MTVQETAPAGTRTRAAAGGRGTVAVLAVLVATLAAALAISFARWPDGAVAAPADDSAAAGFARDMQEHHGQAVEMSMIVRDRTANEAVRRLGYDIALGQQYQIGQMGEWLRFWGLSQTGAGPAMAWMGHSEHAGMPMAMPGMASSGDLEKLRTLSDGPAEVQYLRLMIAHHRGGVEMAEAALARTDVAVVRDLAQKMVFAQSAEIEAMNDLLVARGAQPL
ncbi:MAG: DUF305 domain-containing protein [Sporichthyaceae bacterium]